jgi:hypothetical protein
MSQFDCFLRPNALAINQARQDHLASLGFPLAPGSVLEVGAGIGLLFSLISLLAGVVLGALWAVVVFLYLCVYSVV